MTGKMAGVDSHLKIIILRNLDSGEKTGYDLMRIIHEKCGWKPSPGSMYPALNELLKRKCATVKTKGKQKIYKITAQGEQQLKLLHKQKAQFIDKMKREIKILSDMMGVDHSDMIEFIDKMKKTEPPFKGISKEVLEFRRTFLNTISKDLNEAQQKKIKILLAKTVKELNEI